MKSSDAQLSFISFTHWLIGPIIHSRTAGDSSTGLGLLKLNTEYMHNILAVNDDGQTLPQKAFATIGLQVPIKIPSIRRSFV